MMRAYELRRGFEIKSPNGEKMDDDENRIQGFFDRSD
jgi:hypothetical protein